METCLLLFASWWGVGIDIVVGRGETWIAAPQGGGNTTQKKGEEEEKKKKKKKKQLAYIDNRFYLYNKLFLPHYGTSLVPYIYIYIFPAGRLCRFSLARGQRQSLVLLPYTTTTSPTTTTTTTNSWIMQTESLAFLKVKQLLF